MTQTSDTDEPTPLHLEDLPRSELAEMIKVCENSVYIVHSLTSALYQDLQIETSELRAELRVLRSTRPVSASTEPQTDPLAEHRSRFLELGKNFSILVELWVDDTALGRPYPVAICDCSPWSRDRYDHSISKQDAVAAEIYAQVPQEFHRLIHISPAFSSTVCIISFHQVPFTISLVPSSLKAWETCVAI